MHQNWTTLEKRISHKYRSGWAHLDEYEAIAQWTYRRGAVVMDELYSWTAIAVPNLPSSQGIVDAIALLGYSG